MTSLRATFFFASALALVAGCSGGAEAPRVDEAAQNSESLVAPGGGAPETDPCAVVRCAAGTECVVVDGSATCAATEPDLSPCAAVLCAVGTTCDVIDGEAVCTPSAPSECAAVSCLEGSTCEVIDGEAVCTPNAPSECAAVSCLEGSTCEVIDGEAVCTPSAPSECAAVSCLEGSTCEVIDGEAVCTPSASAPFCGGFGGIECPGAGSCVDDVSDDCDPAQGGADCGGVCECLVLGLCEEGFSFDDSPAVCGCVALEPELDACATVRCPGGTECVVVDGSAVCQPNEPNPCAAVSCLVGTTCEVIAGEAVCTPNEPVPFCGGFGNIPCAGLASCVDDPADECDPDNGGADCGGVCACLVRALCVPGFVFDESAAVCECVPEPETNPCALVDCFPNQVCEVIEGEAVCVAPAPNPCAAVLCAPDSVCVVQGDEAVCEPVDCD